MNYSGVYSISSGALPAGISLNTSTGALTGTPTTIEVYNSYFFAITATNSYGSTSLSFSGNVFGGMRLWSGTWLKGTVKVWNSATSQWKLGTVYVYNNGWVVSK
jgi:hypothetical protein